jgi:hypothetical protein
MSQGFAVRCPMPTMHWLAVMAQQQSQSDKQADGTQSNSDKGSGTGSSISGLKKAFDWYSYFRTLWKDQKQSELWDRRVEQIRRNMDRDIDDPSSGGNYRVDDALHNWFLYEAYVSHLREGTDAAGNHLIPGEAKFALPVAENQAKQAQQNYINVRHEEFGW